MVTIYIHPSEVDLLLKKWKKRLKKSKLKFINKVANDIQRGRNKK